MISNGGTSTIGLYDFKKQLDNFGGVNYFQNGVSYLPNARVMLSNGKIVQNSTNSNLTNDPNVDMTGWVLGEGSVTLPFITNNGIGSGSNYVLFPEYNAVATNVSASTISGGGNSVFPNMIGYTESLDVFIGDGVNKTFLTTYDTSGSTDVSVWLVRADGVLTEVTAYTTRTQVGSKTQVYYPKDGHFVNDAVGGSEGANPALLSTQKLRIIRKTKNYITNSNSNYCGIYGGYDNLQIGIMCHQIGAHHRISGGDHHSQIGGSYNTTLGGAYTATLGGTNNTLGVNCGSSAVIIGGSSITNNSSSGWSIGGNGTSLSGNRTGNLGAYGSTNSGSDSIIGGHTITNTGAASFVFGQSLNNSGNYSVVFGLNNQNSGLYSHIYGRDNSNTKDYSQTGGRYAVGRTKGARTYANGRISTSGDAQTQNLVMNLQTTNATATYAKTASGNQQVFIAENSNNLVVVRAVSTDIATDDSASFELKFHVKRKGGVTTIMGTPTPTKIYNDTNAATWNIAANVSSALAMFRIACTGEASKTINWSMLVEVVEVSRV